MNQTTAPRAEAGAPPVPKVGPETPRISRQVHKNIAGFLFIGPNLIGFLVFVAFPVIFSLVLTFSQWNPMSGLRGIEFVGLRNFIEMWSDEWFLSAFRNNIVFTVVTVPVSMVLGLLVAVALNRKTYGTKTLRTMFFLPYMSNIVAIAVVWMMIFNPTRGPLNQFLMSLGVADPPRWLASSQWAMPAIMTTVIWQGLGYQMIIYLAGLQGIPKQLYEAADIDGASAVQVFFRITVPMLNPTHFFLLITNIINSFRVFAQINVMTNGGPGTATTVLVHYIYRAGFQFYRMGYAAAIAWVLFIVIFAVTIVQWKTQKRWTEIY